MIDPPVAGPHRSPRPRSDELTFLDAISSRAAAGSTIDAPRTRSPAPASPSPSTTARTRLHGVDVARALAIMGMLAVHIGPTDDTSLGGRLYALPHGRASLLFVVVAGVGVSLLAGSPNRTVRATRATLLWRAALLLPAGLALQLLDHGVNVILQSYALLFVVALVAISLPDRWLLWLAGTLAALGPLPILLGQQRWPELFERNPLQLTDAPGELALGLIASGPYPALTWSAPLLVGMWLGRRDLRDPTFQRRAFVIGTTIAAVCLAVAEIAQRAAPLADDEVAVWRQLLIATPHSQMPLWILGSTAGAAGVLGLVLMTAARLPSLTRPLAATGTLALSVYVGHLLVLWAAPGLRADSVGQAAPTLAVLTVAIVASCAVWVSLVGAGPLERLLRLPRGLHGNHRATPRDEPG